LAHNKCESGSVSLGRSPPPPVDEYTTNHLDIDRVGPTEECPLLADDRVPDKVFEAQVDDLAREARAQGDRALGVTVVGEPRHEEVLSSQEAVLSHRQLAAEISTKV
jgi:hypothetical protein